MEVDYYMSTILVVIELKNGQIRKSSLEAVTAARQLADTAGNTVVALLMSETALTSAPLAMHGADVTMTVVDAGLKNYHPDFYRQVVLAAVDKSAAELVLFSATNMGKDLAPRLAVALQAACLSDCLSIKWQNDDLLVQKPLYAGKVLADLIMKGNKKIVSLRPGVLAAVAARPNAQAVEESLAMPAVQPRVVFKETSAGSSSKLDVADAEIIVTGGRGMRAPEHFAMLEEMAGLLNAAVGATRAVVDSGWRPHNEQVGQTGKVVSPRLYFMIGASGSIQHWAGMSGSKCIVAINKDAHAPILQRADYSIVGDLFEVVPALNAEIKKQIG
jgi:electron transfer flavoprotein alpha subunit